MYTLQASALAGQLINAGLPEGVVDVLCQAIGNCAQPLEHRGPVSINATIGPNGNGAALTLNTYGNYPAGANPTTPTTGTAGSAGALVQPGGQQFNPNGPFALLVNNGPVRFNVPFILNGAMMMGKTGGSLSGIIDPNDRWIGTNTTGQIVTLEPNGTTGAGTHAGTNLHSMTNDKFVTLVLDDAGHVLGGYDGSGNWNSPWSFPGPSPSLSGVNQ